jgi:mannose-6-phosphate isomerase-like protein (cupin superfamily)
MRLVFLSFLLCFGSGLKSQKICCLDTLGLQSKSTNIYVKRLSGDSLSSTFCIVIKQEVKSHKHVQHSEQVVVLEGEGLMKLGTEAFSIAAGDIIFIPCNTFHSVKSIGKVPLKVLSIQSPGFDGSDRVLEAENNK